MVSKNEAAVILERRLLHLEERIAKKEERNEWRRLSYDKQELSAIRVALRELHDRLGR